MVFGVNPQIAAARPTPTRSVATMTISEETLAIGLALCSGLAAALPFCFGLLHLDAHSRDIDNDRASGIFASDSKG
jgi:hypothetical protein